MATKSTDYVPFREATDQGHDDHDDALAELVETVREVIDVGAEACEPDGDWLRETDRPLRKAYANRSSEHHERVVLESPGLTAGWRVVHQRTDGRSDVLTGEDTLLDREAAYAIAERVMADIGGVREPNRTGRAATGE